MYPKNSTLRSTVRRGCRYDALLYRKGVDALKLTFVWQDGEVELPKDEPQAAAAAEPEIDMAMVQQLMSMGFSENGCKRAVKAVGQNGVEVCAILRSRFVSTDPDPKSLCCRLRPNGFLDTWKIRTSTIHFRHRAVLRPPVTLRKRHRNSSAT